MQYPGFILSHKGKLDKWLTVRWAEEVPAEGEAVSDGETAADPSAHTTNETVQTSETEDEDTVSDTDMQ